MGGRVKKSIKITAIGAGILGLAACLYLLFGYVRTPVIHGVVLDGETNNPVENAWVKATLSLKVSTIQGDVYVYPSVAPPHLRTDNQGRFVIPRKSFRQPLPPVGFGMDVTGCSVSAETIDDKYGEVNVVPSLWRWWTQVKIHIKPRTMAVGEYDSYVQSLYRYCMTGRFGVEAPAVRERCDHWELDYAITKHEKFLKRLGELDTPEKRTRYSGTLKQLAYLYKKKGDYVKALGAFRTGRDFDMQRNVDLWIREYNTQIEELEKVVPRSR